MKRSEVRAFIQSGITAINTAIPFGSGRISEFNSILSNTYPATWLESLTVSGDLSDSRPFDEWDIKLHIAKKDALDSTAEQYESIVDDCDYISQQLIKKYNDIVSGYNLVTIEGYGREPFIKKHADCMTGVILSFILKDLDQTDVC